MYTLVLFTASTKEYADKILTYLDVSPQIFKLKLYRDNCVKTKNRVKFLQSIDPNLTFLAIDEGLQDLQHAQNSKKHELLQQSLHLRTE